MISMILGQWSTTLTFLKDIITGNIDMLQMSFIISAILLSAIIQSISDRGYFWKNLGISVLALPLYIVLFLSIVTTMSTKIPGFPLLSTDELRWLSVLALIVFTLTAPIIFIVKKKHPTWLFIAASIAVGTILSWLIWSFLLTEIKIPMQLFLLIGLFNAPLLYLQRIEEK